MRKTVELNEVTAKKYAPIITVKTIIRSILSLGFFFVPIADSSIIGKFVQVCEGEDLSIHFLVCALYAVAIAYNIISSWIKVILFRDKASINTQSNKEILDSKFVEFVDNDSASNLILIIHYLFCAYLTFSCVEEDIMGSVPYLIYLLVYVAITVPYNSVTRRCIGAINETKKNYDNEVLKAAERLDGDSEANTQTESADSQPAMKDKKANLEALLKFKELYDAGAITEDEYNKKKDELLNGNK